MWPKGRHCGDSHEKVGIRARMRSASIVRVGRIAILAAWDSVCFIIPRRAEGKQKRMVGSTMICLSYLARASICFPLRNKLRLFCVISRLSHHRDGMRKSTIGGASCTTNSNASLHSSRTHAPSRFWAASGTSSTKEHPVYSRPPARQPCGAVIVPTGLHGGHRPSARAGRGHWRRFP